MSESQATIQGLLEDVDGLRRGARRDRNPVALWTLLIGVVATLGAVAFLISPTMEVWHCDQGRMGMSCAGALRPFAGWWVWVLGGLLAIGVALGRQYRRGLWRPSAPMLAVLAIVGLWYGPFVVAWGGFDVSPVAYPTAAAVTLAAVATRARRVGLAVAAGGLAIVVPLVDWRVDAAWFLDHNAGLTLLSATVAGAALAMATRLRRRDPS